MSLIGEILEEFTRQTFYYKGIPVNIFGIPKFKRYNQKSLQASFYRLSQKELIKKEMHGWILTSAGKRYVKKKSDWLDQFDFKLPKDSPKNMIVMFDIPEPQKAERDWFRFQLKKGGYIMIQKSVWVGPSPLPKEFVLYIEKIKLKNHVKTFRLAKAYTAKHTI